MESILKNAVEEFIKVKDKPMKIVSHLDADGLSSAAILTKTLTRENVKFSLSVVKSLDEKKLKELSNEDYETFIFSDLGSGHLKLIKKFLNDKKIIILDHHIPENEDNNFIHVNLHLVDHEKAENISGSGVCYLFAKELNKENIDLAHIAIIGALGDYQKFEDYNKEILDDAVDFGKIEIKKGLRMFGSQTRPLHKILQYSTDPYIPGITGSETAAISFLQEIGINIKNGEGSFRKLNDLRDEELKKLVTNMILKRIGSEDKPEDIFGNIYLLKDEPDGSLVKDLREYATLLNSCGRLGKYSLGVGSLLENKKIRKEAEDLLQKYRLEIIKSLEWFHKNKDTFAEGKNYLIVNAGDSVKDTLIGTLISIISKSNLYENGKIMIGMAYTLDNNIKISVRVSGVDENADVRDVLSKTLDGKNYGGHKFAGGASIKMDDEETFINKLKEVLS
ncbi:DHH family phosphoesterase [archaeon]|nr:DHH family phosphoesterase [archaeon]